MLSPTVALSLLAAVSPVLAGVQEIWYNVTYVNDANPDGLAERRVIGINGTWPYVYFVSSLARS
jgi:iron transport multicopper oxidase